MRPELVGGFFWLAIGLISIYGSIRLGLGKLNEPGSGLIPFLAGCFIGLMAIIVLFQSLLSSRQRGQIKLRSLWEASKWHLLILTSLLIVGYILVLEKIGFFLSSFFLLFLTFKVVEKLSWRNAILIPILALCATYLLFDFFLKATLPEGILGF